MNGYTITLFLVGWLPLASCARKQESANNKNAEAPAPRRDVNVLLITIDTLRADYLSCYGRKMIAAPNIDTLAARGVRCAQAFAQVPLTAPSHASILKRAKPDKHGNVIPKVREALSELEMAK